MPDLHSPLRRAARRRAGLLAAAFVACLATPACAQTPAWPDKPLCIKAGKFRPIAITTPQHSAELPDVPTLAEQGVSGADIQTGYAMYVTAGLPRAAVDRLVAEVAAALRQPDVQVHVKGLGGEIQAMTPEQFAELNSSEFERFSKLVRNANIKADGQ